MTKSNGNAPVVTAVVGTAGHIDHGKSSLVERLTGVHPSRLKEERERGMTIDIGYAEFPVEDGTIAGIIDVPGHEKFIRNMVAGAAGVDFVILVVAADDGVMPQTREHLQIMRLLGIERGMTVLTKIDLVDSELLEIVEDDVREYLSGTFLAEAPMLRVSNTTGEGIDEVARTLRGELRLVPARESSGVFRMPVQRSFSVKGYGTVVTGVPTSGHVAVGDVVEVLPDRRPARVRGIQVHHAPADEARAGHRAALNLADVNYRDIERGDVVATPGFFGAATLLEARLEYLEHHDAPLRNDMPVRLHVGTADVGGRVVLLDRKVLLPGESGLVQIKLDEPTVCAAGDRYILRLASPVITLGGGTIVGETRWRFKRFRDWLNENLAQKEAHLGDRLGYLEYVVRSQGCHPVEIEELARAIKAAPDEVRTDLLGLEEAGHVRALDGGRAWIHSDMLEKAVGDVSDALLELHASDALKAGFQASQIAKRALLDPILAREAAARLVEQRRADLLQGRLFRHREFSGGLTREDVKLVDRILEMHTAEPFGSPITSELVTALGKPVKKVRELVSYLVQMGELVQLTADLAISRAAAVEAERLLVARLRQGGEMPSSEFKQIIDATRKYVIPLLEYFDKKGVTERDGNVRRLADGHAERLFPENRESMNGSET